MWESLPHYRMWESAGGILTPVMLPSSSLPSCLPSLHCRLQGHKWTIVDIEHSNRWEGRHRHEDRARGGYEFYSSHGEKHQPFRSITTVNQKDISCNYQTNYRKKEVRKEESKKKVEILKRFRRGSRKDRNDSKWWLIINLDRRGLDFDSRRADGFKMNRPRCNLPPQMVIHCKINMREFFSAGKSTEFLDSGFGQDEKLIGAAGGGGEERWRRGRRGGGGEVPN